MNIEQTITHASPEKWTEIELLPEWDEEFYDVYTAKKFGKWHMLKTLKAQYKDDPEYQSMIRKEFDVRYNLTHPNIVIITDFEDVPGVGLSIITDDVYGHSLRKLIDEHSVTPAMIEQLRHDLLSAIDYIQTHHIVHRPISPERIYFTEIGGKLKLIDVGFDQRGNLEPAETSEDIYNYGVVLKEAIDSMEKKYPLLQKIAERCTHPNPRMRYRDVSDLHLALERRSSNRLYLLCIIFLAIMSLVLAWLNSPYRPQPPEKESIENVSSHDNDLSMTEFKKQ